MKEQSESKVWEKPKYFNFRSILGNVTMPKLAPDNAGSLSQAARQGQAVLRETAYVVLKTET